MKRLRPLLAFFGPAIAGFFLLAVAVPPPALFYHEHAGGSRAHVHGDDEAVAELLELFGHPHEHGPNGEHDHPHGARDRAHPSARHHRSASPAAGTISRDDGSSGGHWHENLRLQRGLSPRVAVVSTALLVETAPQLCPTCPTRRVTSSHDARGPPSHSLNS